MYGFNQDNIGYVIMDPRTRALIAIDTGDFDTSYKIISEIERQNRTELKYIFSTHSHGDHVGGNLKWKEARPGVKIVGGSSGEIPGATV